MMSRVASMPSMPGHVECHISTRRRFQRRSTRATPSSPVAASRGRARSRRPRPIDGPRRHGGTATGRRPLATDTAVGNHAVTILARRRSADPGCSRVARPVSRSPAGDSARRSGTVAAAHQPEKIRRRQSRRSGSSRTIFSNIGWKLNQPARSLPTWPWVSLAFGWSMAIGRARRLGQQLGVARAVHGDEEPRRRVGRAADGRAGRGCAGWPPCSSRGRWRCAGPPRPRRRRRCSRRTGRGPRRTRRRPG